MSDLDKAAVRGYCDKRMAKMHLRWKEGMELKTDIMDNSREKFC